jgi:hypothetical protein
VTHLDSLSEAARDGTPSTVEVDLSARLSGTAVASGSPRPLLQVEDLAVLLGLSPRGARLVLERGELPGFRIGRRWFVRPADLEAAIARKIEENRGGPDPDAAPAPSPDCRPPVSPRPGRRRAPRDRDAAVRILRGLPAAPIPARKP